MKKCCPAVILLFVCALFSCASQPDGGQSVNLQARDGRPSGAYTGEETAGGQLLAGDDVAPVFPGQAGAENGSRLPHASGEGDAALVPGVSVRLVSSPAQAVKGRAFPAAFVFQAIHDDGGEPVPGVPVTVRYPVSSRNGVCAYASLTLLTDASGRVEFLPAVPSFSCRTVLTAYSGDGPLPSEQYRCEVPFQVSTDIKGKPMAIALTEFDRNGKPLATSSRSSSALLTAFIQNGYTRVGTAEFTPLIAAGDETGLYDAARKMFGNSIPYLIYGTVQYEKYEKTPEGYTIALSARVKAADLRSGEVLFESDASAEAIGKTEAVALEQARRKLFTDEVCGLLMYGI